MFLYFVEISMPIDMSWMCLPTRSCTEYFNGVENYLEYPLHHVKDEDIKINFPSGDCCNRYRLTRKKVHIHLLYKEIMRTHTFWYLYGEEDSGDEDSDRLLCDEEVCEVDIEKVDDMVDTIKDVYPHMADGIEHNTNDPQ